MSTTWKVVGDPQHQDVLIYAVDEEDRNFLVALSPEEARVLAKMLIDNAEKASPVLGQAAS